MNRKIIKYIALFAVIVGLFICLKIRSNNPAGIIVSYVSNCYYKLVYFTQMIIESVVTININDLY